MALGEGKVQIAVVMTIELKEDLQAYAKEHHWSMSQAASILIGDGISRWKTTDLEQPPKTKKR